MSLKDKIDKGFDKAVKFFNEDDYDDDDFLDEEEDFDYVKRGKENNEAVEETGGEDDRAYNQNAGIEEVLRGKQSQVLVIEPKAFSESQEIAEHILKKRAVIVNLQKIAPEQGKRIIDFLSGTIYAVDGELQKISTNTFLCTPRTFGVAGKISEDEARKL